MGCMRRWHSSVGGLTRPSGIRTPVPYSATKNLTWPSGMADEATNVVAIPVFPSINWQSNETIMLKDLVSNKLPEFQNFWKRDEFVFLLTSSPCQSWHAAYSESSSISRASSCPEIVIRPSGVDTQFKRLPVVAKQDCWDFLTFLGWSQQFRPFWQNLSFWAFSGSKCHTAE